MGRCLLPWLLTAISALLLGCSAVALTPAPNNNPAQGFPVSILDDVGRLVEVKSPPERIISLAPSNTEILFALGLADRVVGVDDYSDFPPEAKGKERVGSFAKTSIEKVVSLGPDLILATEIHLKTVVPELERRGLTVILLQPKRLEGVLDSIRLVGNVTGREREASSLAAELEGRIDRVASRVALARERPRVFFELSPELHSVGPGSFVDDMLTKAGGENIASDSLTQWPQLSQEVLLLKDPQVILLSDHPAGENPERVRSRPGWQGVSAVAGGLIFTINPDLANRPGPRAVEGLEEIARALHPELFP